MRHALFYQVMQNSAAKFSSQLISEQRDIIKHAGIDLPDLRNNTAIKLDDLTPPSLASYIDATYLSPPFSSQTVENLCNFALEHGCASVCIPPYFVPQIKKHLENSSVKVCSVADFPFGSGSLVLKTQSIQALVSEGCDEVDFVINYSQFIETQDIQSTFEQLCMIRAAAPEICLKAIIETSYLQPEHIISLCSLLDAAQIDYAKTSTGFSQAGASVENIALMYASSSKNLKLKASGGIGKLSFAKQLIAAGASRLGTSKADKLITELQEKENTPS
ncbi:deoxyribose-phosphate aldolase [bacterium]|nr:deoxyribose-phosphate aldolase [bacterium]